MSEHPLDSPLVKRSERFNRIDECRHDQTKQRKFEKTFLSTDWRNKNGDSFDYGDYCKSIRKLLYKLDAYWIRRRRKERFEAACNALEDKPKLQETLLAIKKYRKREKIIKALHITKEVYRARLKLLYRFFNLRRRNFH